MWWSQQSNFPIHKSSSSSTTTPFPRNLSGLASGSSIGQGKSVGLPSYFMQAPDNRFSQQYPDVSGIVLPHGTSCDFWKDSTSNSASIQHGTPQYSLQQGACYNHPRGKRTTLQHGTNSCVDRGNICFQTDSSDFVSAPQNRLIYHNDRQDFSAAATDIGPSMPGWDHSTFHNEEPQHGYLGHSQSDATFRQPDMRHNACSHYPGPLLGQRSLSGSLCQPRSPSGVEVFGAIKGQPNTALQMLANSSKMNFNDAGFLYQVTNNTDAFSQLSSTHLSPPLLQFPTCDSNGNDRNQCWKFSSTQTKDKGIVEDLAGTYEHGVGQNDMLCWNRTNPSTARSMEECPVTYQRQQSLNVSTATEVTADSEIRSPATFTKPMQAQGTSNGTCLNPFMQVHVHEASPESESAAYALETLQVITRDPDCFPDDQSEDPTREHRHGDTQDLTTTSSISWKTCTSQEVRHQVACSHQQSTAACGLQSWVSAAPPMSTCVQQEDLPSFDPSAYGSLSVCSQTRSPSAGFDDWYSGGDKQGVEKEESVFSFLSADSGTPSLAPSVDFRTGVSHVHASVRNPVSAERFVRVGQKISRFRERGFRRDSSSRYLTKGSSSQGIKRVCSGGLPYVCPLCQHASNELSELKVHLRIHAGENSYICSYWKKAFPTSSNLSVHLRIHTGEKPYTCFYCQKVFRHLNTLKYHQRTHTREKPHT